MIADRDYLTDLETSGLEDLFNADNTKVRDSLGDEEQDRLMEKITHLKQRNIHILPDGALESYLPYDEKDIRKAIELTKDDQFERWLANAETGPDVLLDIAQEITNSH